MPGRGVEVAQAVCSDQRGLVELHLGLVGRKEWRAFVKGLLERGAAMGVAELAWGEAHARIAAARALNERSGQRVPDGADQWLGQLGAPPPLADPAAALPPLDAEAERAALAASAALHDLPLLRGWLGEEPFLREVAAALDEVEKSPLALDAGQKAERLRAVVQEAVERYYTPERRARLASRLLEVAAWFARTGHADPSAQAAAAARALARRRPAAPGPLRRAPRREGVPGRAAPAGLTPRRRSVTSRHRMAEHRNPAPTVDVVISLPGDRVVLVARRFEPLGWALPGGFVDEGETVEAAAVREAREETGLAVTLTDLLWVYSDPRRDRAPAHHEHRLPRARRRRAARRRRRRRGPGLRLGRAAGPRSASTTPRSSATPAACSSPGRGAAHDRAAHHRGARRARRHRPGRAWPTGSAPAPPRACRPTARWPRRAPPSSPSRSAARSAPRSARSRPAAPLAAAVAGLAARAALDDPRQPPLTAADLPALSIRLAVLGPLAPALRRRAAPRPRRRGRDPGLAPRPAAARPRPPGRIGAAELFLKHACLAAGLPARAHLEPDARVEVFEVEEFGE